MNAFSVVTRLRHNLNFTSKQATASWSDSKQEPDRVEALLVTANGVTLRLALNWRDKGSEIRMISGAAGELWEIEIVGSRARRGGKLLNSINGDSLSSDYEALLREFVTSLDRGTSLATSMEVQLVEDIERMIRVDS